MQRDSKGRRGWKRSGSRSNKQQQVRGTYAVANRLGHVRVTGADEAAVTWGVNGTGKKRARGVCVMHFLSAKVLQSHIWVNIRCLQ